MNRKKLSGYYNYRKIIKWLLILLGVYPLEKPSLFYRSLPYIHIFLYMGTTFGILGFIQTNISDILLVSKRLGLLVSFLSGSIKLGCMIIYREDTKSLKVLDEYFDTLIHNPRFTNMVLNGVTKFRHLSWAISLLVFFTGSIHVITPIVLIVYQHMHHIQPIKYMLPYLSIYPWTIHPNGILYKLHFTFETLATYSLLAVSSSVEPLFSLYVIQMIGQLREMSYRLSHIDKISDGHSIVRECVLQYELLMKYRNMIQNIFGPIVLQMMISNSIVLCFGIFQLSQIQTISMGQMIFFVTYVSMKMLQTFICTWSGTQLIIESEHYRENIYCSNWQSNKKLMMSTVIMLAQKPLTLTACKYTTISVDIFVTVLNTTISYFFLLQTLQ